MPTQTAAAHPTRSAPTTAIIFAGGKGTRMSELTAVTPKPGVDVCGRPLISYIIDTFIKAGVRRVIVAAGYKSSTLKRILRDHYSLAGDMRLTASGHDVDAAGGLPPGVEVIVHDTGEEAETAERIIRCRHLIPEGEGTFFVTYGDTVTNLDLTKVAGHYLKTAEPGLVTIGFPDGRYGEVEFSGGKITRFKEKERPKFYVNRGFMILDVGLLDDPLFLNARSLETDVLPVFADRGSLAAYQTDAEFVSVDSVKDLQELNARISKGEFVPLA